MPPPTDSRHAEIAHVLFLDIVDYSQQPHEAQARLASELTALARAAPEFQRAEADGDLVVCPTGDGMALAFFRYPLAPAQCAVEIARAAAASGLRLRMGLHSGPVSRLTDATGKTNLSGSGVNLAQRVMDCGNAGHILLSATVAEVLQQFESWRGGLRDLGACEVKHGERLHLYNLCTADAGNPAVPENLAAQQALSPHPRPLSQKQERGSQMRIPGRTPPSLRAQRANQGRGPGG